MNVPKCVRNQAEAEETYSITPMFLCKGTSSSLVDWRSARVNQSNPQPSANSSVPSKSGHMIACNNCILLDRVVVKLLNLFASNYF